MTYAFSTPWNMPEELLASAMVTVFIPGVAVLFDERMISEAEIDVALWISAGEPDVGEHRAILSEARAETMVAVRLANDKCGAAREKGDTDGLNAVMLGASPDWIDGHIDRHVRQCHALLEPLVNRGISSAVALGRFIDWMVAFYRGTEPRTNDKHRSA